MCIIGCLAGSLASTHWMPVATLLPVVTMRNVCKDLEKKLMVAVGGSCQGGLVREFGKVMCTLNIFKMDNQHGFTLKPLQNIYSSRFIKGTLEVSGFHNIILN